MLWHLEDYSSTQINIPISGKEFGILKEGKYFFFEKINYKLINKQTHISHQQCAKTELLIIMNSKQDKGLILILDLAVCTLNSKKKIQNWGPTIIKKKTHGVPPNLRFRETTIFANRQNLILFVLKCIQKLATT